MNDKLKSDLLEILKNNEIINLKLISKAEGKSELSIKLAKELEGESERNEL